MKQVLIKERYKHFIPNTHCTVSDERAVELFEADVAEVYVTEKDVSTNSQERSTDYTAKEAIGKMEDMSYGEIVDFVAEDEQRKTVLNAVES